LEAETLVELHQFAGKDDIPSLSPKIKRHYPAGVQLCSDDPDQIIDFLSRSFSEIEANQPISEYSDDFGGGHWRIGLHCDEPLQLFSLLRGEICSLAAI
jgi:hypothetical protein